MNLFFGEMETKLNQFLHKWLKNYVNEVLGDLIKLSAHKISNQYLRGLVFQLYENNGVIKRSEVDKIVKSKTEEEQILFIKEAITTKKYIYNKELKNNTVLLQKDFFMIRQ